jgi:hypothetical protein
MLLLVSSALQIFFSLIHHEKKKRKRTNLSVKQKLELIEKLASGVSVASVCDEYGYLDLTDIRQYPTPPPPISLLNRGYTAPSKL